MGFHRLTAPSYFGGLPGGYNYINNLLVGTPAIVDGPRATGPNLGTYFLGLGENALSAASNRGLAALAENTDILDSYAHRDLAIPAVTADVLAGAPVSSIVLTGPIFVGMAGTLNAVSGIRKFVTLVDDEDNEIYSGGSECQVTAISPDTPGDVWSVGNVTLTVSPAVPGGVTYRVYYSTRGNTTTLLDDALVGSRRPYNRYNGGDAWADGTTNPATFVTAQLDKILTDLSVSTGTDKVGGDVIAGSPYTVAAGTLRSQLVDIYASLNAGDANMLAAVAAEAVARDAAILVLRNDLFRVRFLTAAGTVNTPSQDATIILNPAAPFNLTLPAPAAASGHHIILINGDGTLAVGNEVTLVRDTGATKINNLASDFILSAPFGRWILSCDGVGWHLV